MKITRLEIISNGAMSARVRDSHATGEIGFLTNLAECKINELKSQGRDYFFRLQIHDEVHFKYSQSSSIATEMLMNYCITEYSDNIDFCGKNCGKTEFSK